MNILKELPIQTQKLKDILDKYPFSLDTFQQNAIVSINNNHNVLVTAATGSGKSLVAEYAIEKGVQMGKKVIYTSPIKSLSNQKFYEFKKKFPNISVGILTGDIKFNPTADCIIMTTEILRNLLYNKNIKVDQCKLEIEIDVYHEVETVIFDEVHYINDRDRGTVWEECLMMLPPHVKLVMLSATIDRAEEFANWLFNIKQVPIDLIPNDKRVIPLKHYIYMGVSDNKSVKYQSNEIYYANQLVEVLDEDSNFNSENYGFLNSIYKQHYRERTLKQGKQMFNEIVELLEKKNLCPAIFFVFSRKKCQQYASYIDKSLNTNEEYAETQKIVNYYLSKLDQKDNYIQMQQYFDILALLKKGICIHHSGLIPVFKEIIEILFSKNLIKLLFATETFAVGVNMPTKTVIFTDLQKFDSFKEDHRFLLTHEYQQMSGRAGRRGLDDKGVIIHLLSLYRDIPSMVEMRNMMNGKVQHIESKFSLNYQFILKMIITGQTNLLNFIETSLMSKDINQKKKYIEKELSTFKMNEMNQINIDMKLMVEYDNLTHPNSLFKIPQKQMKKNRARIKEIENSSGFDLVSYQKYKKEYEKKQQLEDDLIYYQTMIYEDIMKIIGYLDHYHYIRDIQYIEDLIPEKVTIKGVIGSQINDCNPLLFTEILSRDFLDDLSVEQITALMSLFTDSKTNGEDTISPLSLQIDDTLKNRIIDVMTLAEELRSLEEKMGIYLETDWNLNLNMVEMTYLWSLGKPMKEIEINIYEGNFIKEMIKISTICSNVEKMARILYKNNLADRMMSISDILNRDIVNVDSLYIKI